MRKAKELLINFIRGFCMALADSVPGVSGGTVAFLLGFYDRFISSLDDLIRGPWEKRFRAFRFLVQLGFYDRFIGSLDDLFHGKGPAKVAALSFLVKLAFGWIIGFGLSAAALTSFFDSHIYEVSSLFMGFIVFAIPIVGLEEKRVLKGRARNLAFAVLGAALVVAVTLLNPTAGSGMSVAVEHLDAGLAVYVFFAAMVAITAMVLPGISGSTLLLIFGLYVPIMGAVRAVMGLDMAYLPILLVFAAGVAVGVLVFVRLIRRCLERFRSQTVYAILGMMAGSLYSITQGPLTLAVPQPAMELVTFSPLFFAAGGLVVGGLQLMRRQLEDPADAEGTAPETKPSECEPNRQPDLP